MKHKKKRGQKRKQQHCNPQSIKKAPVKKKRAFPVKPFLIGLGILAGIAVIVLVSVFGIAPALKKDVVDMARYIQASAEGKNGEGELSYTYDDAYLLEALGGADNPEAFYYNEKNLARLDYLGQFRIDATPAVGLSNNDVVTISVVFPVNSLSKAKVKAENLEFTYVVNGLEE